MAKPAARLNMATRRRSGGSFVLGMFVGLAIGLVIALSVAFYLNKTPIPFAKGPAPKEAPGKAPPIAGLPQGGAAPQTQTPPPSAKGEKPKFDFYRILPGSEEAVSEKELRDRARQQARAAQPSQPGQPNVVPDVYFIQAGSFQNPADADIQKARLALLGFESNVEPASLPDRGTFYRVRLGPYTRLEDINRVRQQLAQNGIDANLVKLKDPKSQ